MYVQTRFYSPTSSAKVKNEWSYTFFPPYIYLHCVDRENRTFYFTNTFVSNSKLQPTRCNVLFIYLFLQTPYMFQAVSPPVIRST